MTFTQAAGTPFSPSKDTSLLQDHPNEVWVPQTYFDQPYDESLPSNDGHLGEKH